jgi:hypothetical protein
MRIRLWAGGPSKDGIDFKQYAATFLHSNRRFPHEFSSYILPLGDVVNGEFVYVAEAIDEAAKAVLRGKVPRNHTPYAKRVLSNLYARMRREYKDETFIPPWPEPTHTSIRSQVRELVAQKKFAVGVELHKLRESRDELNEVIERSERMARQEVVLGSDGVELAETPVSDYVMTDGSTIEFVRGEDE